MAPPSRRAVLAAGAVGLTGGCLFGDDPCALGRTASVDDWWHRPRRDSANTAAAPPTATPDPTSLSTDWESTWQGRIVDLVAADGCLFATMQSAPNSTGSAVPTVRCVTVGTGDRGWQGEIAPETAGPTAEASAPFYADDTVYASALDPGGADPGTIAAFAASDGSVAWRRQPPGALDVASLAGGFVLVRTDTGLVALRRADGQPCWTYRPGGGRRGSTERIVGQPARIDEVLVASIADDDGWYGVVGIDATAGTEAWRRDLGSASFPPRYPVVSGAVVLVPGRERIVGLNPIDGNRLWQTETATGTPDEFGGIAARSSQFVAAANRLVTFGVDDGRGRWERQHSFQAPTIGGEYVFGVVGADDDGGDAIAILDRDTGEPVARHEVEPQLRGRVTVAGERLFVRTQHGGDGSDGAESVLALA